MRAVKHRGLRIHLVPKNAHSSIANSFEQLHHNKKLEDVKVDIAEESDDKRMMVVRHPCDRAVSAWSFFCLKNPSIPIHDYMEELGYKKLMTWDEFYPVFVDKYEHNIHTMPQVEYTGGHEIDYLVAIEDLNNWWEHNRGLFVLPSLLNQNASLHQPWEELVNNSQRETIESIFDKDLNLYRRSRNAPN